MTDTPATALQKEFTVDAKAQDKTPAHDASKFSASAKPRLGMSDALYSAVEHGDILRVKALIEQNPATLESRDATGNTVLLLATKENRAEIASWALMKQADPDARNDIGMTALMFAATNGNVPLATALLDKAEASILLDNALDETADDIARSRGNFALAARIVQRQQIYKQKIEAEKKEALRQEAHHDCALDTLVKAAVIESAFMEPQQSIGGMGVALAAGIGMSRTSRFIHKVAGVLGLSKFLRPKPQTEHAPQTPAQADKKPAPAQEKAVAAPKPVPTHPAPAQLRL